MFGFKKRVNTKNLRCDKCKANITIGNIKMLTKPVGEYEGEPVTMQYFECGKCSTQYPVTYQTPTLSAKIQDVTALRKQIDLIQANSKPGKAKAKRIDKLHSKYTNLVTALVFEQDILKNKFGGE